MNTLVKTYIQNYYINEGRAGYEPMEGDTYSDYSSEITGKILDILIEYAEKPVRENNASLSWDTCGLLQRFLGLLKNCYLHDNKKIIKISALYDKMIKICKNDTKFINSWETPENFLYELAKNEYTLRKIIYDNSLDHKMIDED